MILINNIPPISQINAQINLAWLLHRSSWILPIPGTSSLKHFGENLKATEIILNEEDMSFLG